MLSYVVLARMQPAGKEVAVPIGGNIVFDTTMSDNGTAISYDANSGVITFGEEGFYYIDWYVATQTGLSDDGSNWAIQTSISEMSIIGSSHTKIAVTSGFAIINATVNETAKLVNVSNEALILSHSVKSKAALSVYKIA